MDNKYRLLDVGEFYIDPEMLTVSNGWQRIEGSGYAQEHTVPLRRPDDGKGKYLLCEKMDGEDFWRWGVGWVKWDLNHKEDAPVWRKAREVEKPSTGLWVVIQTSGNKDGWMVSHSRKHYSSWESACADAKRLAMEGGDGAEFAVCHIDRTFRCEVSVVEREVGK